MRPTEIREKSSEELKTLLASLKEEQFNLKMQKSLGQLEDASRASVIRKDIARVNTILTEKKTERGA